MSNAQLTRNCILGAFYWGFFFAKIQIIIMYMLQTIFKRNIV